MIRFIRRIAGVEPLAREVFQLRRQLAALQSRSAGGAPADPGTAQPVAVRGPGVPAVGASAPGGEAGQDDLRSELAGVRAELAGVRAELAGVRGENGQLRSRVAEQATDLANLRAAQAALAGAPRTDALTHEPLAEMYHALVTQQLTELARLRLRRAPGADQLPDRGRVQARMVRDLVRLLITSGPADEDDVAAWLVGDQPAARLDALEQQTVAGTCGQARRLLADLAHSRQQVRFVDEVPRGEPLDGNGQLPWRTCPPDGLAEFVVAPGYLVDGRTYAPALVHTVAAGTGQDGL